MVLSAMLKKLQLFCTVAEMQSITGAARELGVSQPAVSVQVRDIERFFGVALLQRDGKKMIMTEAGKVVYDYATATIAATKETRDLVRLFDSAHAGSATVGASESPGAYRLPTLLAEFKLEHPRAKISLDIGSAVEMWERTRHGALDLAVVAGPEPPDDLQVTTFCEEPLVVVCAPDDEMAGCVVRKEDLGTKPVVSATRRREIGEHLTEFGLDADKVFIRLGNDEGIKYAVGAGLGVAIMYRCVVERELADGSLAEVRVDGVAETRRFYLITSPYKRFSALQQHLLQFLANFGSGAGQRAPARGASGRGNTSPGGDGSAG